MGNPSSKLNITIATIAPLLAPLFTVFSVFLKITNITHWSWQFCSTWWLFNPPSSCFMSKAVLRSTYRSSSFRFVNGLPVPSCGREQRWGQQQTTSLLLSCLWTKVTSRPRFIKHKHIYLRQLGQGQCKLTLNYDGLKVRVSELKTQDRIRVGWLSGLRESKWIWCSKQSAN